MSALAIIGVIVGVIIVAIAGAFAILAFAAKMMSDN